MAKCMCVVRNNERFAHGHCLAFHETKAVGHVVDPVTLNVERGPWSDDRQTQGRAPPFAQDEKRNKKLYHQR